MSKVYLNLDKIDEHIDSIRCGDEVFLTGTLFTARDAAHKRILELIQSGSPLPFTLQGASVYYAGPTQTKPGCVIGSCGPTTSSRMDAYAPTLLDHGLKCMIGKGDRSDAVVDSIIKNHALYLCAVGGAGAIIADSISSCEVVAFDELGCESVKKLTVNNMPTFCAIDALGNDIFRRG